MDVRIKLAISLLGPGLVGLALNPFMGQWAVIPAVALMAAGIGWVIGTKNADKSDI